MKLRILQIKDTIINDSSFKMYLQQDSVLITNGYVYTPIYLTFCKAVIVDKYKGRNFDCDTIEIYTGRGNGDCGYYFELDSTYIVFSKLLDLYRNINGKAEVYRSVQKQYTDDCYGTRQYEYKFDRRLKYLKHKEKT